MGLPSLPPHSLSCHPTISHAPFSHETIVLFFSLRFRAVSPRFPCTSTPARTYLFAAATVALPARPSMHPCSPLRTATAAMRSAMLSLRRAAHRHSIQSPLLSLQQSRLVQAIPPPRHPQTGSASVEPWRTRTSGGARGGEVHEVPAACHAADAAFSRFPHLHVSPVTREALRFPGHTCCVQSAAASPCGGSVEETEDTLWLSQQRRQRAARQET